MDSKMGLLQRSGIVMTEKDNEVIKKNNDVIRTLLDSIKAHPASELDGSYHGDPII